MPEKRLEYIISARDQTATAARTAQGHLQQVASAARMMGTSTARSSQQSRTALQSFGAAAQAAGRQAQSFAAAVGRASTDAARHLGRAQQAAHSAAQSMGSLAGSVARIGVGAGVAGGALATAFGAMGISSNKFKENTMASLTALLKSRQEAEKMFTFLSRFADATPFDDEEVVAAGKAMLTFGLNARRDLTLVGDTAAAMKVPLEQVVHALAKLKSGQFDIAEMGPVGITREGLQKQGLRFKPSGEPEDRDALFGAGKRLLQSQFGGTMSGAASGFDAQFSTMISNLRRVAAQATTGLFKSLIAAFGKVSAALERFMKLGGSDKLRRPFDMIGRAIEAAADQLPRFLLWVRKAADDGLWHKLKTIAVGAWRTIGGAIAGVANVLWEAIRGQKAGVDSFKDMGEGVKAFAATAVRSLGRVVTAVMLAAAAYGVLLVAIGALTRNPARAMEGAALAMGGTLAASAARSFSEKLAREIESLDIATQMRRMGMPGWRGAFGRGFVGFNNETDRFLGTMRGAGGGGGVTAPSGAVSGPAAADFVPNRQFGSVRTPPTVTRIPGVPVPAPVRAAMPDGDPFAPVRLPDGRVVSRISLLSQQGGQGAGAAGNTVTAGPNGSVNINLTVFPTNRDQILGTIEEALTRAGIF